MQEESRVVFNAYLDQQAALNGVLAATSTVKKPSPSILRSFDPSILRSFDPSIPQKLIEKQGESSAFLASVNTVLVDEMQGETLGLGVTGPLASRTNTAVSERQTRDPSVLNAVGYQVKQTNSDTHMTYGKVDARAKFPDFQVKVRHQIVAQQARDRIMIGFNGFNGVTAAADTNLANFSLL